MFAVTTYGMRGILRRLLGVKFRSHGEQVEMSEHFQVCFDFLYNTGNLVSNKTPSSCPLKVPSLCHMYRRKEPRYHKSVSVIETSHLFGARR
jgi:hypothetical protein